jgi:hypothetical protein
MLDVHVKYVRQVGSEGIQHDVAVAVCGMSLVAKEARPRSSLEEFNQFGA